MHEPSENNACALLEIASRTDFDPWAADLFTGAWVARQYSVDIPLSSNKQRAPIRTNFQFYLKFV
jgi:hypothetical protein